MNLLFRYEYGGKRIEVSSRERQKHYLIVSKYYEGDDLNCMHSCVVRNSEEALEKALRDFHILVKKTL
jgi:hypothetical protein